MFRFKERYQTGFIDGIGVIQSAKGKGFGELMLHRAFAYYGSIDRAFVEFNVDTGNESGLLKLYEKVALKPKSSWQHFENKNGATS